MRLSFILNGHQVVRETAPDRRVIDLLREDVVHEDLLGYDLVCHDHRALDVKEGCGTGECGACSILVDGVHRLACLMLAAQLEGREVVTAAGLGTQADPHPLQRAFAEHGAVQCGYCTPGMVVAAAALLEQNPAPTRGEIRQGLSGNLCRCTGYVKIVDAVQAVAQDFAGEESGGGSGDKPGTLCAETDGERP